MRIFKKIKKANWLSVVLILSILTLILVIPTDPDFWWHLKMGENIAREGISCQDKFTFTFPNYCWPDYEWVTNLIIFGLYRIGGLFPISLLFSVLIFFAFFISGKINLVRIENSYKESKNNFFSTMNIRLFFVIVGILVSFVILGVRVQVLTILGLSLTYFILIRFANESTKLVYLLPVIFLVWANSHAGFLVGLVLIAMFIFLEGLKKLLHYVFKFDINDLWRSLDIKQIVTLSVVFILCLLAGLITPFFYKVYTQAIFNAFDTYGNNIIVEWFSPSFDKLGGQFFAFYTVLTFVLLVIRKTKPRLGEIAIVSAFWILGFSSIRHLPLFVVMTLPSNIYALKSLNLRLDMIGNKFLTIVLITGSLLLFATRLWQIFTYDTNYKLLLEKGEYPQNAVSFLKEKKYEGNMFNSYKWGGFLVWEYPEKKVFIDGRMASWKQGDVRPLKEYVTIANLGQNWKTKLDEYEIQFVLVEKKATLASVLREEENWSIVFEDDLAVVFLRNE